MPRCRGLEVTPDAGLSSVFCDRAEVAWRAFAADASAATSGGAVVCGHVVLCLFAPCNKFSKSDPAHVRACSMIVRDPSFP